MFDEFFLSFAKLYMQINSLVASLGLSAWAMEQQRMYSQRGNVLFPRWVIVSLARFHKAQRLKEAIIPTAGRF